MGLGWDSGGAAVTGELTMLRQQPHSFRFDDDSSRMGLIIGSLCQALLNTCHPQ
jgi:hypothetical protein